LIPVDGILISEKAAIDYSLSLVKRLSLRIQVTSILKTDWESYRNGSVVFCSQSYLTQLWSNDVFRKLLPKDIKV
jgi:Cu+-exporting ATPase